MSGHDGSVLHREAARVRHRQSMAGITERLLMADRTVMAIRRRQSWVGADEVHCVRQAYPVASGTVVVRVTGSACRQTAHPVRLLPVGVVSDRPLGGVQVLSLGVPLMARGAVRTCRLGGVTIQALVHGRRPDPFDR